jgi:hypothetical protein
LRSCSCAETLFTIDVAAAAGDDEFGAPGLVRRDLRAFGLEENSTGERFGDGEAASAGAGVGCGGEREVETPAPSPAPVSDDFDFSGLDKPPASGLAALLNTDPLPPVVQDATKQLANFRALSEQARQSALDSMNHRIEAQQRLININTTLRRNGIDPSEYTSPGYESLKKRVDPLYEETGIFIPAPVSFTMDAEGMAGNLADQWNVLP